MRPLPAPSGRGRAVTIVIATALLTLLAAPAASATSRSQVERALASQLRALPGKSSALVLDDATGAKLGQRAATTRRIPASVTKIFTTSSALLLDGPEGRLTTEARATGEIDDAGVLRGDLLIRGGGDPALRTDQIAQLARIVRRAGVKRITGRVRADLAGWTRQQGTPGTGGRYHSDIGGRIGPLVTLRGFAGGGSDPASQVVARMITALRAAGVGGTLRAAAPLQAPRSTTALGRVSSPTIARLATATNGPSDNFYAEMLLRGIGARHGSAGTTGAGLAQQRTVLRPLRVNAGTLADGSGLSRRNRLAPSTVVKLLREMRKQAEAGPALRASLPVAGRSGTLAGRMRGTVAQDRCRAKTGTLSNVSALAGYCTTRGGRDIAFAILMNGVNVPSARRLQDRILVTIAGWSDRPPREQRPAETTPTTPPTETPTTPVPSPSTGGATASSASPADMP